ncbi:MAG: DUF2279 domain-containing protein [Gemmatimonadaceae bacterium]
MGRSVVRPGARFWRTSTAAVASTVIAAGVARAQEAPRCPVAANQTARRIAVGMSALAGNVILEAYFHNAWWSGPKAPHWFIRNDWDGDFRDQDKFGHFFGGYHLTRIGNQLLRAACIADDKALLWGAMYAWLFQLQIQIFDGYQAQYGFEPADVLGNTLGASYALAQHAAPWLLNIKPTISWAPTEAYHRRFEHGNAPRATLDYSGQTYWFSADVNAILPASAKRFWPPFLRVSAGHSITEYVNPSTGQTHRAQRKLLLSLDLDAGKLPGHNRYWRFAKHQLSYYHFPAPALQLTPWIEGVRWYR